MTNRCYAYVSTQTNFTLPSVGTGSHARLWAVNVGTGAASAVLTLKEKDTNGAVIATIDASAKGTYLFGGIRIKDGIYCVQTGGNGLCTITYE